MINILQRPFPAMHDPRHRWLGALAFGIFVYLFLQIFRPFGLDNVGPALWIVNIGYGIVTFGAILLMQFGAPALFPAWYREEEWNVGNEILHTTAIILLVAAGNFIYSAQLGFFPFNTAVFGKFLGFTAAVGVIPVALQALVRQNRLQKKYLRHARALTHRIHKKEPEHSDDPVVLKDEEGRPALQKPASALLALESADNYVIVYYLSDDRLKKMLIRNALKTFGDQLSGRGNFFRCHRSWLINLDRVDHVEGNARGYSLELHPEMKQVPVARRKTKAFREQIDS